MSTQFGTGQDRRGGGDCKQACGGGPLGISREESFFLEVIFHPRERSTEAGTECPVAAGANGVGQGPEGALETT